MRVSLVAGLVAAALCLGLVACGGSSPTTTDTKTLDSTAQGDVPSAGDLSGEVTSADMTVTDATGSDLSVADSTLADATSAVDGTQPADLQTDSQQSADLQGDLGGDASASGKVAVLITPAGGVVGLPDVVELEFPPGAVEEDTVITVELLDSSSKLETGALRAFKVSSSKAIALKKPVSMSIVVACADPNCATIPLLMTVLQTSSSAGLNVWGDENSGGLQAFVLDPKTGPRLRGLLTDFGVVAVFKTQIELHLDGAGAFGGMLRGKNNTGQPLYLSYRDGKDAPIHRLQVAKEGEFSVAQLPLGSCSVDSKTETINLHLRGRFDAKQLKQTIGPSGEMLVGNGMAFLDNTHRRAAWFGMHLRYSRPCTEVKGDQLHPGKSTFAANTAFRAGKYPGMPLGTVTLYRADGQPIAGGGNTVAFSLFRPDGMAYDTKYSVVKDMGDGSYQLALTLDGLPAYPRPYSVLVTVDGKPVGKVFRLRSKHDQPTQVMALDSGKVQIGQVDISYEKEKLVAKYTDMTSDEPFVSDLVELSYAGELVPLGPSEYLKATAPRHTALTFVDLSEPLSGMLFDLSVLKFSSRVWSVYSAKDVLLFKIENSFSSTGPGTGTIETTVDGQVADRIDLTHDAEADVLLELQFLNKTDSGYELTRKLTFSYEVYDYDLDAKRYYDVFPNPSGPDDSLTIDIFASLDESNGLFKSSDANVQQDETISFADEKTVLIDGPDGKVTLELDEFRRVIRRKTASKIEEYRYEDMSK